MNTLAELLKEKRTLIMGVLNITPDSFADGGKYFDTKKAIAHAEEMIREGADIIDIGGESSRPDALPVSTEEEQRRVLPVIMALKKEYGNTINISIDTYKQETAKKALELGVDIVNDISGFTIDPRITIPIAYYKAFCIINHIRRTPQTMQHGIISYTDIIADIQAFFSKQIVLAKKAGVSSDHIILDPGFGFGKTIEHNMILIDKLKAFTTLGHPILIGISRKSSLGSILQEYLHTKEVMPTSERLEPSLAAAALAVYNGAKLIRTHDVLTTRKAISIIDRIIYHET